MTTLLAWLATYAIHSSLLLGSVAALTAMGIRREAWRERMWKVALVGGLLTASLQLAFSVRPFVGRWELPPAASAPALRPGAPPAAPVARNVSVPERAPWHGRNPDGRISLPAAPRPVGIPARLPSWPALVVAAWATWAIIGLGRLLHYYLRLQRLLHGRHEVTDAGDLAILAGLRRQAGVWRMVRLTAAPRCSTPFVLGSSEICVPGSLFHTLTPEERCCALAHELAHVARRDPLWQLIAGVIQAVFFFQPLNRLAARRLREDAEFVADDWAVRQTGSPMGLARCLIAVAGWAVPGTESAPEATMAMAEGGSPLILRVERLLAHRGSARVTSGRVWTLASVVLLGMVVGAAPGVITQGGAWDPHGGFLENAGHPVPVHRHPDPDRPLALRYAWALDQARKRGDREVWIAYETRSIFPPGRVYGVDRRPPAGAQLTNFAGGTVFRSARDRTRAQGSLDLVILLGVSTDREGGKLVLRAACRTPRLELDLEGRPVYWLAAARPAESVELLAALGRSATQALVREKLVQIVAVHDDAATVVPRLREVLEGDDLTTVRAAAAEGLAWHPSPVVIDRLFTTALTDRSREVQAEAVEALGDAGDEHALDRIIGSPRARVETRAEAVETLGRFERPEVLHKLVGIAFGSYDPQIQDEAVEAVADLGLPESQPALEQVALEHPDPVVRREAVEPLARTGRVANLETLYRLALTDPEPRIQREAIERMADFRLVDAAPFLSRIVWEHDRTAFRCEAVRIIGALPAAVGLPLLDEIVAKHPDGAVREHALAALGRYAGEESESRLREIARSHPSDVTRQQALELLAREARAAAPGEDPGGH